MNSGVATSGLQPRAFLGSHVTRRTRDLVVGSAGGSCLHSPICDLIHLLHPLLGLQHASPSNCTLVEVDQANTIISRIRMLDQHRLHLISYLAPGLCVVTSLWSNMMRLRRQMDGHSSGMLD